MKTLDVISLGLQFLVALLTTDPYTVAHDYDLHKWNSYLWAQILKQLTGARLSAMPIYCLLCYLKESCSPCFKEEYVLWLTRKLNSKTKSPFVVFYVFASVYNMEMLAVGVSCRALSWAPSVHWWILSTRPLLSRALFQGMHELLAPIVFTLHCDHQAFLHASESAQPRQVFMGAPSIFQPCFNLFFNLNTFYIEDFVNCKHLFEVHVAEPLSNCNPISAVGKLGILNIFASLELYQRKTYI